MLPDRASLGSNPIAGVPADHFSYADLSVLIRLVPIWITSCLPTNRRESSDLLRFGDQKRWERIHGPHSLGLLGPAIRRDDIVHAQVFHELAVVIKAMSDRIHPAVSVGAPASNMHS